MNELVYAIESGIAKYWLHVYKKYSRPIVKGMVEHAYFKIKSDITLVKYEE